MVTNTMVLIVVAALATLVLASVLADEFETRAHAAKVEVDIKTDRACTLQQQATTLQQQATAFRSEAVTSRDQLNEVRVHRLAG
jgi:hypothetical protein